MKKPKQPNPEFENAKKLISFYLTGKINYPKEIKIAKKLLSQFPIQFWEQYRPEIQVYSLSIFLTPTAQSTLNKEFSLFSLTKPKASPIFEEATIIDLKTFSKPRTAKTVMDFVDGI